MLISKQRISSFFIITLILFTVSCFIISLFAAAPQASAATGINQRLNFQGRLFNAAGAVIPDGDYNIEFKIVQDGDGCNPSSGTFPCGGSVQWTETRTGANKVTVRNGYFSVELGSVTALPTTIWNQDTLWLTLNLGGTGSPSFDGEMKPMRRLSAAPYALNTKYLEGLAKTDFIQLAQGVQNDATTNASIFLNKQGASGNILQLQKAAADVFVIGNSGTVAINNNSATALTVQNGSNNAFGVDTTNIKVAIGLATSSASSRLAVAGQGVTNGITLGDGASGSANLYVSANDTLKTDDSLIVANDLAVNGGDLTSTSGTFNLLNNTATNTLNVATTAGSGATQTINIGSSGTAGSTSNTNIGSSVAGTTAVTGPATVTNRTSGSADTLTVSNSTSTGTIAKFLDGDSANPVFSLANGGAASFRNQTDSTSAFQIQNSIGTTFLTADTTNQRLSVTTAAETLSAELNTNSNFSTQWTGTGWNRTSTTAQHNTANTNSLFPTTPISITADATYELTYTIAGQSVTDGYVRPEVGGACGYICNNSANGTFTEYIRTIDTSNLSFVPSDFDSGPNFNGTISNVSLKRITAMPNAPLAVKNIDGSIALEVRANNTIGQTGNLFIGTSSGVNNVGSNNNGIGVQALQANTTGFNNNAMGYLALQNNTTGFQNNALGTQALFSNTTGFNNNALGTAALAFNDAGYYNNAIGNTALALNTGGFENIAIGDAALFNNTNGSNIIAIGQLAGVTSDNTNANTTGANNIFIGLQAGPGTPTQLQGAAAIGVNSLVSQDNSLVLGCTVSLNGCVASTKVGIGTAVPSALLHVSAEATETNPLFRITDNTATATDVLNVDDGGATTFHNQTDSSAGFQVQNAAAASLFTINTTTGFTGIGGPPANAVATIGTDTTTAAGGLYFGTDTNLYRSAADSLKTDDSLNIAVTSSSALLVQNASAVTLLTADTSGMELKVSGTTSTFAKLTIDNAHFKSTQTTAPTIGTPSACGTTPTAVVTSGSTDSAGSFYINAGSATTGICTTVITFNKGYGAAPKSVILTRYDGLGGTLPANGQTQTGRVTATSTTTFTVNLSSVSVVSVRYGFFYWVVE